MRKSYRIIEVSKNGIENYSLMLTVDELKRFLKEHRDAFGYIAGVGGDRKYEIFAVEN